MEYMAIKVKGFKHWLWFSISNVFEENGIFEGKGGWGERGSLTEITVHESEIIGRMNSDKPQYR